MKLKALFSAKYVQHMIDPYLIVIFNSEAIVINVILLFSLQGCGHGGV